MNLSRVCIAGFGGVLLVAFQQRTWHLKLIRHSDAYSVAKVRQISNGSIAPAEALQPLSDFSLCHAHLEDLTNEYK